MRPLPRILLSAVLGCACLPLAGGCQLLGLPSTTQIAPGEDPVLVNAERDVTAAFEACDAFLVLENQRREWVKANLPDVHKVAERLRKDGPPLFREARTLIRAYKAVGDTDSKQAMADKVAQVARWADYAKATLQQIRGGL